MKYKTLHISNLVEYVPQFLIAILGNGGISENLKNHDSKKIRKTLSVSGKQMLKLVRRFRLRTCYRPENVSNSCKFIPHRFHSDEPILRSFTLRITSTSAPFDSTSDNLPGLKKTLLENKDVCDYKNFT